jgi:uncharacterized coiled-coil protein SlyX
MTTPESSEVLERLRELTTRVMALSGDVTELNTRVGQQETETEQFRDLLDQLEAHGLGSEPTQPGAGQDLPDEDEPRLDLPGLVAWVRENVTLMLERKIPQGNASNWCRSWWLHPEAIARFDAAHRSWLEACVSPGNAMVVYFEHLDHQLGVLMGPDGTFSYCSIDRHREGPIETRLLGQEEPGEDYYLTFKQAHDQRDQTYHQPEPWAPGGHQ